MKLTADQIQMNWVEFLSNIDTYISSPRKEQLTKFYETHYCCLMDNDNEELSYTCLSTILDYETISIITVFKTHIQNNFQKFLCNLLTLNFYYIILQSQI